MGYNPGIYPYDFTHIEAHEGVGRQKNTKMPIHLSCKSHLTTERYDILFFINEHIPMSSL
jgi:hypothetical protein